MDVCRGLDLGKGESSRVRALGEIGVRRRGAIGSTPHLLLRASQKDESLSFSYFSLGYRIYVDSIPDGGSIHQLKIHRSFQS